MSFWIHPEFTTEENRLICQEGTLEAVCRADGFVFISQSARNEFERIFPGFCDRQNVAIAVAALASRFPNLTKRAAFGNPLWELARGRVAGTEEKLWRVAGCTRKILGAIPKATATGHCRGLGLEVRRNPSADFSTGGARPGSLPRIRSGGSPEATLRGIFCPYLSKPL